MRIAILGPAYPFRGGIAANAEYAAYTLQQLGQEVRLYTFTVQYPRWLFPGKSQYWEGEPPFTLERYRMIHSLNPISWVQTAGHIARWKPDVVLAKFWLPAMGVSLGSILHLLRWLSPSTLRVALLHNLFPHERRKGDKPFTRYFLWAVQGGIAFSETVSREWRAFTQRPLLTLFLPTFHHFSKPSPKAEAAAFLKLPPEHTYFLFFGLVRPYKGLDILLEAWKDKRLQAIPNLRLLIAGECYENPEKYHSLLSSPELKQRVIWHEGFVPDEKVPYYFSIADAVILPYRTATQSGIVQVAYHFERPIIATRVGGLPELVEDGASGLLCEPEPHSLAEAIVRFLSLPAQAFHEGIQRKRAEMNWETYGRRLITFLENLRHAG
ncbi:MAG: glycosyltransferase [Bacteroidia bacterium]|nr:glycosyltransferase [Bacteroidia bacterium]MDW8235982.1 glycosyltransferase [Bacteroidia bacterium]